MPGTGVSPMMSCSGDLRAGPGRGQCQPDEFLARELGAALALSCGDAEEVLFLAAALEVSLPGTRAAFRSGVLSQAKARV